ncbi:MAG: peroxiredoxin Q/BCP [Psychrobacter glaciei]|jgi:peroxiredoxin Q/BCP
MTKDFTMAKPTTETIALPDFPVTMVRELDGHFIHDDIDLKDLVAHTDKGLILYFYPKDSTPGCTTQATEFTARLSEFDDLGYDIVGVSRDSVESHEKFIAKYDLQIPLISDSDEKLCQYFEVIKEKNMYGKITLGLVRSAFVFDKDGNLTHAQRNLRAKDYTERLLTILAP